MNTQIKAKPQRILIFGATSGMVQEASRLFARRNGACFFLVSRDLQKLNIISQDLIAHGAAAVQTYGMELSNCTNHQTALEEIWSKFEHPDIMIIAWGSLGNEEKAQHDYAAANEIINVNFTSVVSLLVTCRREFETARKGTIAVISSVAGERGRYSNPTYGASKAALSTYCQGLRARLYPFGVHVLTIKPGIIATPMTAHLKRSGLMASAAIAGNGIYQAIERKCHVAYTPSFWRLIMFIVRSVPESIAKRLKW